MNTSKITPKRTQMSQKTVERLTRQLQQEIECHPYREELVMLATEQLLDDV